MIEMKEPFRILVDGVHHIDVNPEDANSIDVVRMENGDVHHMLYKGKGYSISMESMDYENRSIVLRVNGIKRTIKVDDAYDRLIESLGFDKAKSTKLTQLKAPMPGMVLKIEVEVGQVIQKGDPLLILEAMKMENVIKSDGEGTISEILIKTGQPVDKNQILIKF